MSSEQDKAAAELRMKLAGRLDRIRDVLKAFDVGGLSEGKALSRIEEIASGEDDRIVVVGLPHTPEIQT